MMRPHLRLEAEQAFRRMYDMGDFARLPRLEAALAHCSILSDHQVSIHQAGVLGEIKTLILKYNTCYFISLGVINLPILFN
jgi:hypothetical protein